VSPNRTVNYLLGTSPRRGWDGDEGLPAEVFDDPTFVPRLSFKGGPPSNEARAHLSETLESAPPDVCFFLDSSIWDATFEADVWPALLARTTNVFVIPNVRLELQGWIARHPAHLGSQALLAERPPLVLVDLPGTDTDAETAWAYYASLLLTRRQVFRVVGSAFQQKHGREPTLTELVNRIQRLYGTRGLAIAYKYRQVQAMDSRATDESLVYFAAEHALRTGQQTVVLTKDQDVMEQFYKLWWFLDTHYRAMLIADEYAENPFRYKVLPLPDLPRISDVFEVSTGVLLQRGPDRMRAVLPSQFDFVAASCWVVGNSFTPLTFGAERSMYRLLQAKGATGGLVSTRLGHRNLHPWLAGLPLGAARFANSVAIVRDRTWEVSGTRATIGLFDVAHSFNTKERFTRLVPEQDRPKSALWTPS
jgi:hypothetical protein